MEKRGFAHAASPDDGHFFPQGHLDRKPAKNIDPITIAYGKILNIKQRGCFTAIHRAP